MKEIIQIGNICADASAWANPSVGRVYDQQGLAPTINSGGGGYRQPYIIEEVKDGKNNCGHERQI